jgi:hypothetical protein
MNELDFGWAYVRALNSGETKFADWLLRRQQAKRAGAAFDEPAPETALDRALAWRPSRPGCVSISPEKAWFYPADGGEPEDVTDQIEAAS